MKKLLQPTVVRAERSCNDFHTNFGMWAYHQGKGKTFKLAGAHPSSSFPAVGSICVSLTKV